MSKTKEQMMRSTDLQMEYYGKFMDWMYDNLVQNQLTSDDIDNLEETTKNSPRCCSKQTISRFTLKPTNNPHYNLPEGA